MPYFVTLINQRAWQGRAAAATGPDLKPPSKSTPDEAIGVNFVERLPSDLLTKIHGHFTFLDRFAFAAVCKAAGHPMTKQVDTPWLVFPGETDDNATFFSLADNRAATARTTDLGTREHVVLGSSFGWLATADEHAGLHIVDPFTGEHAALPNIRTIPFFLRWRLDRGVMFYIHTELFQQIRYGGLPPPPNDKSIMPRSQCLTPGHMRQWFYRKLVLSAYPDPNNYAAMLSLDKEFGVPAFATSDDKAWKVAASRDGIEDAIHHNGQFYSVSYSGAVEAWERDGVTGEYTSTSVAPAPNVVAVRGFELRRRYIVAMRDGRLAVVLKYTKEEEGDRFYRGPKKWYCVFKVLRLLRDAKSGARWTETRDIGDTALFVGMNSSLCVSAAALPGKIKAVCVYFTDDVLHQAAETREREASKYGHRDKAQVELQQVGVYSLMKGTMEPLQGIGPQPWSASPLWFTPSV